MSGPGQEVRSASQGDLDALLALVQAYWTFEGIDGFDRDQAGRSLAWLLDHPRFGRAWVASDGGRVVGYLLACFVFSLEHGGMTAEIDEFFVEAAARGKGLGRRLLETAEAASARHGCTNVSLQLGSGNDEARAFYTRCGYGPRRGYDLLDKTLRPTKPSGA